MGKPLKYPCLVLDHDDTTVDSTAHVHYPSFVEAMAELRPGVRMTLEEYFAMNCSPGIAAYFRDTVRLTAEEADREHRHWLRYAAAHSPAAYPGIRELLERQRAAGGYFCVVSHNLRENILRDYAANGLPEPDLIYGSDLPPEQWKPSAYPILDILDRLALQKSDLLVVDDLIPGFQMAAACGVAFAAACWAHRVPQVRRFLAENNAVCFSSPEELAGYLFP